MKRQTYSTFLTSNKLLFPYLIIPCCLVFFWLDKVLFDFSWRAMLPRSPENMAFFNIFFVLPHIIASTFCFFEKEYFHYYQNKLLWPSLAMALVLGLSSNFLDSEIFQLILAIVTTMHLVGQQLGITALFSKKTGRWFVIWKVTGILLSIWIYLQIFEVTQSLNSGGVAEGVVKELGMMGLMLFTFISGILGYQNRKNSSLYLYGANYSLLIVSYFFWVSDYIFLSILIPRFLHDTTAFIIYAHHDQNAFGAATSIPGLQKNFLYRILGFSRLPIGVLCVVLAIALGQVLSYLRMFLNLNTLVFSLIFFHYLIESLLWKSGTLHRQHLFI